MSKYLKCLSEMTTCAFFYSMFHHLEKKQVLIDDSLTLDLWKKELSSSWSDDAMKLTSISLQAGLTFLTCRTLSPVISNRLFGGIKSFDSQILMVTTSNATATLPKQGAVMTGIVGIGIIALQPILYSSINWKKTPEEHRRESIDSRWFKYLSIDVLLDTFLFSSYLFRRLYLLAGPVVAHAGTALSYAASHSVRHYDTNGNYSGLSTFMTDLSNSFCAQYGYQMSGSIILSFLCNSFAKYQEVGSAFTWSFLEVHSLWRNAIMSSVSSYSFGSVTSNNKQILCIHKNNQRRGREMTAEDIAEAKNFIDKYIHVYFHDGTNIYWEDLADILYHFRSITSMIVYNDVDHNSSNGYYQNPNHPDLLVVTFPQDSTAIAPLIATDSLYSKCLTHYRNGDVISKEDLSSILVDDLCLFSIDLEKLKSFEAKFIESTSLWDVDQNNLSETRILEIVDRYFKSIMISILKVTPSIPAEERSNSLPSFPRGIIEGITVSPSASTSSRNKGSHFSESTFQDYCLATRRGAMVALNQNGLTIRKWNQLLELYSNKYTRVQERKEKWLNYLNGEDFEQLVTKFQYGQSVEAIFEQDQSFLNSFK